MSKKLIRHDEDPAFTSELNKYLRIKDELEATTRAIADARSSASGRAVLTRRNAVTAAAERLLAGDDAATVDEFPRINEEIEALQRRELVLQEALSLQKDRYEAASKRIKEEASAMFRPQVEDALRKVVQQMVALDAAVAAFDAVIAPLWNASKHDPHVLPLPDLRAFQLEDPQNLVRTKLGIAVEEIQHSYGIRPRR